MVLEGIPGAAKWPDHRGDCALEVGDGDRCIEDADGAIVPGVFSFGSYPVCGAAARGRHFHRRCFMLGRDRSSSIECLGGLGRYGLF